MATLKNKANGKVYNFNTNAAQTLLEGNPSLWETATELPKTPKETKEPKTPKEQKQD